MTFGELLTMIGAGGGSFGAGAAAVALYMLQRRSPSSRKSGSGATPKRSEQMGPGLSDSQRFEAPFVSKEVCDAHHEAVDSQLHELRNGFAELRRGHEAMAAGLRMQEVALARLEGQLFPQQPMRGGAAGRVR